MLSLAYDSSQRVCGFICLFFTEKHLDAQFLFNNYTRVKLGQNGDQVNLYVPCRTSHATVPTTLSRILNDGVCDSYHFLIS